MAVDISHYADVYGQSRKSQAPPPPPPSGGWTWTDNLPLVLGHTLSARVPVAKVDVTDDEGGREKDKKRLPR